MSSNKKLEQDNEKLILKINELTRKIQEIEVSVNSNDNTIEKKQLNAQKKNNKIQIIAIVVGAVINIGLGILGYEGNKNNNEGNKTHVSTEQQKTDDSKINSDNTKLLYQILQYEDKKAKNNDVENTKKIK